MARKNQTAAMTERAIQLRNHLADSPDPQQQDLMEALNIANEATLYSLLQGMAKDQNICRDGEYCIFQGKKRLTVEAIEDFLRENDKSAAAGPAKSERLIYLYDYLQRASRDGGMTFAKIHQGYVNLWERSGGKLPQDPSLNRTILRDLEALEGFGINLERPSSGSKKYRLAQEYLPKLTRESAAGVYVSMLLYHDTLLNEATACARAEMERSIFKGDYDQAARFKQRIYVLGDTLAEPSEFSNLLGKLILAVRDCLRIKITYINNEAHRKERRLEPLGLICKRSVWYLVATDLGLAEVRTFRIDQIIDLHINEMDPFAYPEDFDIQKHIGASWGVYCNDEITTVRLRFAPAVAQRVKNLNYHPSQQIIATGQDGSIVMQFRACGLIEMKSWILQWGRQVEVLEPESLRQQIMEEIRTIAAIYGS